MDDDLTEHTFKSKPCLHANPKEWQEMNQLRSQDIAQVLSRFSFKLICLVSGLALSPACTQFPDLDSALSEDAKNAPYPDLVPVETLKARVAEPRIQPETTLNIQARVAALKARASRLRGSVIDSPTRQRMSIGVTES